MSLERFAVAHSSRALGAPGQAIPPHTMRRHAHSAREMGPSHLQSGVQRPRMSARLRVKLMRAACSKTMAGRQCAKQGQ